MKAPWIKNFYYIEDDTYIIPGFEAVTLGTSMIFESYDPEANKYESQRIWDKCVAALPSLKDAEVRDCFGLMIMGVIPMHLNLK